jgi:plasmid maintenance system antidote protein VapI
MKLKEYLTHMGIRKKTFADRVGVSATVIENVLKGKDITLSTALRIKEVSYGKVKCEDMAPTVSRSILLKKNRKKKEVNDTPAIED